LLLFFFERLLQYRAESLKPNKIIRKKPDLYVESPMPPQNHFQDLIVRVRAGDQDASTELAQMFEPFILRVIRFAMRRKPYYAKIRSRVGSSDICQSVFKSLFVGLKEGRFELDQPDQVQKLLRIMSRFKIATEGRRLSAILRDVMDDGSPPDRADSGPSPEKAVEDQDLAEAVLRQFSEDELDLLQQRLDGQTWPAIAAKLNVSADTLRRRLERAVERVKNIPSLRALNAG
jgi:RNA polymerase sigma factor (sigma-70 family)